MRAIALPLWIVFTAVAWWGFFVWSQTSTCTGVCYGGDWQGYGVAIGIWGTLAACFAGAAALGQVAVGVSITGLAAAGALGILSSPSIAGEEPGFPLGPLILTVIAGIAGLLLLGTAISWRRPRRRTDLDPPRG